MKRLLLCLTALVALAGCGEMTALGEPLSSAAPATASSSASVAPVPGTPGAGTSEAPPVTVPTRLRLGDITAPVVPITLDDSSLTPPNDPQVLGWWGKRAGSQRGSTLLTGHTVHDGGGTFDDLEDTPLGALAHVNGHSYEVKSVAVISKGELAERAPVLFAQTGRPKLVLVTCEDYNPETGHYASNVVVVLNPVR